MDTDILHVVSQSFGQYELFPVCLALAHRSPSSHSMMSRLAVLFAYMLMATTALTAEPMTATVDPEQELMADIAAR